MLSGVSCGKEVAVEEEIEGGLGGATVSCVQFPVIIFCLMEFIQLAPLERNRCGGRQNKCAFFFPRSSFPNHK